MTTPMIGRYEVKAELGRGGMATVYHAFDPRFKREVAIKVLPREFLHDPSFRARFEREAQTIAALEHSAIVPVYDFGEQSGVPYFVMRLMSGGSLADQLKQKGPLTVADVARLFKRLAPALDYAHSKGVIHRDLKPGNILFDQNGDPFLSDFGIAKLTQQTAASFTGSAIVGTPSYMSPEQAKSEGTVDARSDVYAMGAILFELLTGRTPYKADTPMGVVVKHITEPVPSILSVDPNLPPACEQIITQAMAKDPAARFASTGEMASALEAVAQGKPLPTQDRSPVLVGAVSTSKLIKSEAETIPPISAPPTKAKPAKAKKAEMAMPMWGWVLGGIGLLSLLVAAGLGGLMLGSFVNPPTPVVVIVSQAPVNATAQISPTISAPATRTPVPSPTNTLVVPPTPPTVVRATNPAAATQPPPPPTPDLRATASVFLITATVMAADDKVQITGVLYKDGQIKVDFRTIGFQAGSAATKIRFYYNGLNPQSSGIDYVGLSPWSAHYEKPPSSTEICALLLDLEGKVRTNTGNCVKMP